MRFAIISDSFLPETSSAAIQLTDLSKEFIRQKKEVIVFVPDSTLKKSYKLDNFEEITIIRLKVFNIKSKNLILRAINEFLMPFLMIRNLKKIIDRPDLQKFNGIIWYSPSIFLGPLVNKLKKNSKCKTYLILRDIFPEWALDLKLLKKGPIYFFFKTIAFYQYSLADTIGIQSSGNKIYFKKWIKKAGRKLEVLDNWLEEVPSYVEKLNTDNNFFKNKKIFIHAGNTGLAQGINLILDLIKEFKNDDSIGFVFVGKEKNMHFIKKYIYKNDLKNILILDEVDPKFIPSLYKECFAGIVSLDIKHKTHNIPGKFISYLNSGLPVLAAINKGNDLENLITENKIGYVSTGNNLKKLKKTLIKLIDNEFQVNYYKNSKDLFYEKFTSNIAAKKILNSFFNRD
tara:strand:- start:993 stop:2192 length:1200 start_codon:yes stop_codon:yes gene_type:complete